MTELITPTVPIALIHDHPDNPRRNAVADDGMVASIRAQGIAQAVTVMPNLAPCAEHPDEDCYLLGAGHRRKNGGIRAGLTELPVVLRADLVTPAQQRTFMLVENVHREDLTAVEEADVYVQLGFDGLDVDEIAELSGRSVATVKSRLKLAALSEAAREKVHVGDATLTDIAVLEEFADDKAATAKLEQNLGTDNYQLTVAGLRARRSRIEHRAQVEAGFIELGAVRVASVPGGAGTAVLDDGTEVRPVSVRTMHTAELREPTGHDGCLGYLISPWDDNAFNEIRLVCTDPTKHPRPATAPAPMHQTSEWEKQQAARAERAAQRDAACQTRAAWLRDHFAAMFPTRSHGALADAARAALPLLIIDGRDAFADPDVLLTGLNALPDTREYGALTAAKASYAATLADAKPTTVLHAFAGYLAALVVDQINVEDPQFVDDLVEAQHMLAVWDWLRQAGYPLSDADKADRTALEVRHTELADEAEAEAS